MANDHSLEFSSDAPKLGEYFAVPTPNSTSCVSADDYEACVKMCYYTLTEGEAMTECIKGCREIKSATYSSAAMAKRRSRSAFIPH